ncbi:hypothetical protein BpHYR1_030577 [Brachionus plicatilis]|uniref:Uncharacterized protein n=1 Tax=Brachionus plicatilis TaxID=10195 RepID=A0A3M7SRC1_BRAPC|nr:hypothetical protein BpHYR1_030577 [Brachionus plicatilis]
MSFFPLSGLLVFLRSKSMLYSFKETVYFALTEISIRGKISDKFGISKFKIHNANLNFYN